MLKNWNYFNNWFGLCLQPVFVKILYVSIIIHWGSSVEYDWSEIDAYISKKCERRQRNQEISCSSSKRSKNHEHIAVSPVRSPGKIKTSPRLELGEYK